MLFLSTLPLVRSSSAIRLTAGWTLSVSDNGGMQKDEKRQQASRWLKRWPNLEAQVETGTSNGQ
jgi:hypothetical protein